MNEHINQPILDRFVVLEGLDGSGTTTQLQLLAKILETKNKSCYATCEPTNGPIGNLIRNILKGEIAVDPRSLALLFAADRSEHLYSHPHGIIDKVNAGNFVISDRYLFSSLVYQGLQGHSDYVVKLNSYFPLPKHIFFIDTPPEICQQRVKSRLQFEIFDNLEFQQKIRKRYIQILQKTEQIGVTVHKIDGTKNKEIVSSEIWMHLTNSPILNM